MRSNCLIATCAALLLAAPLGGCGSTAGSGLLNSRATAHAPRDGNPRAKEASVLGSRTALSDAREQSPATPEGALRRSGTASGARERTATPSTKPASPPGSTARSVQGSVAAGGAAAPSGARQGTAEAAEKAKADGSSITVEDGDTLLRIANRHRVSVASLMAANNLSTLSVAPGQRLVIPKR